MSDEDKPQDEPNPPEPQDTQDTPDEPTDGPETFSREYVEKLRRENAEHRTRAKRADDIFDRLVSATVARDAAGILADASDLLQYCKVEDLLGDDGFPDTDKVQVAAHDLASRKPHLQSRRPSGDVDQGPRAETPSVSLADILRDRA